MSKNKRALRTELTRDEMIILRLVYVMQHPNLERARRDRLLIIRDLFSASRGLDPLTIQRRIDELVREYEAAEQAAAARAVNNSVAVADEKRRREALALKAKYEELGNELRRRGLIG